MIAMRHSHEAGQHTCSMMVLSVRGMRLLLTCTCKSLHQAVTTEARNGMVFLSAL